MNFIGAVVFSVIAFFEERSANRPLTTSLALHRRARGPRPRRPNENFARGLEMRPAQAYYIADNGEPVKPG